MRPSNSDSSVTRPQEALTSAWVEAQMRVPAQSRAMPNVFNAGNVVKQLIWTRVLRPDGRWATHPCDQVPKEPPCSSSRKCMLRVAALPRCSQPDSDNHSHGLHIPAGCQASL